MNEIASKYNVKKILELKNSIAPMYLVQDEKTKLFGVQTHMGNFKIEPEYQLDEEYDFTKEYALARVDTHGKLFLLETEAVTFLNDVK